MIIERQFTLRRTNYCDSVATRRPWNHYPWDPSGFRSYHRSVYIRPSFVFKSVRNRQTYNHGASRSLTFGTCCRTPVSDAQLVASEQALFRVRSDLLEKQRHIEQSTASEVCLHCKWRSLIYVSFSHPLCMIIYLA